VALARALAPRPLCLLLDEPLSSLDAQLKDEMMILLRKINREGQTIIHVTHDYREALALANRVSIIQEGKIIQTGSPGQVFSRPVNRFVADFTGVRNFFQAKALEKDRLLVEHKLEMQVACVQPGDEGYVMFGKEQVLVSKHMIESSALNSLEAEIKDLIPVEEGVELLVDAGIPIRALVTTSSVKRFGFSLGDSVWIHLKATAITFIRHA
jgi:ABC-type Fe3+/spermidine/putrescine transport system ATPase subunit